MEKVSSSALSPQDSRALTPPAGILLGSDAGPRERVDQDIRENNEGDSSLPVNWSKSRKWLIVVIISGMSFIVNLSTVICAPASQQIMHEFHSNSNFLGVFYITVWDLGEAIAPLYIGPLSERIGRLPVYHFYNILFIIFTAITGCSNSIGMIVGFRLLTGAATTSICLNPSIVGDMFTLQTRGAAMATMSLMPLVGTAIGPIIGGLVTEHLSWRWTFWITAILTGAVELAMVFVLRETYLPQIMRQRARNDAAAASQPESVAPAAPFYTILWRLIKFLLQPFVILLGSRAATVFALYLSIVYAYLFLLATTLATVYQEVYSFSESDSGLIYLAQAIGMFIGTILCRFTLDYFIVRSKPSHQPDSNIVRSELRLIPAAPGMILLPAALLMYGWTLELRVHWAAPAVATGLAGFCLSTTTIPTMSYLVDIFGDFSASAIAAVLPLRYLFGTFLPVAAPYMYARLGYGWANSLLAFILILCLPPPLLLIFPFRKGPLAARITSWLGA
ncbi:hypothetical protein ABHI18_008647 [Aspergillus niger]